MKAIGGYFGLELRECEHYHKNALCLNSARNCLEYILHVRKYTKVYIPYYTCDVILEPFKKLNIPFEFYPINQELDPVTDYKLKENENENEAFLYTNYFGLKQNTVKKLAKIYHKRLIVDNAQAFYSEPLDGIDTFYSPRKFFGVADGGYLYIDKKIDIELEQDISYARMSHLLKRIDISPEFGYNDFRKNDDSLINQPIKKMSNLTSKILSSIDYDRIKKRRLENFQYLHNVLHDSNLFKTGSNLEGVPLVYPYWINNGNCLKKELINNKVFVPTFWPNIKDWCLVSSLEFDFANNIVFMPIDQRIDILKLDIIKKITYATS